MHGRPAPQDSNLPSITRTVATTLAACAVLAGGAAAAQDCEGSPSAARLLISVDGVHSNQGLMTASLYGPDRTQFLVKNGALKVWRTPARAPTTTMCIWLAGPGPVSVAIYHDENANYKLDVGPFGPTEGYGFSRNPRILFSKPSLASTLLVAHAGDNSVHIRLHYP
jgi:uncharacterized protein (DUF2141 family)